MDTLQELTRATSPFHILAADVIAGLRDRVATLPEALQGAKTEEPQWVRFIANNPLDERLGRLPAENGGDVTRGLLDGFELRRD